MSREWCGLALNEPLKQYGFNGAFTYNQIAAQRTYNLT